jgi:transposase
VRVTTAFSRLLRLGKGVVVKKVRFGPDTVIVEVALRRRRLVCPECGHSTRARKDTRPEMSSWRHLDLGTWRLELRCQRRRLWCPVHGARTEAVPFARPLSDFTRDFECLVVRHEAPWNRVGCRSPPPGCRSSSVKRGAA